MQRETQAFCSRREESSRVRLSRRAHGTLPQVVAEAHIRLPRHLRKPQALLRWKLNGGHRRVSSLSPILAVANAKRNGDGGRGSTLLPSPQRFPHLLNDRVIRAPLAMEIVHRGGQKMRTPLRTDPANIFEYRGQELVFVGVVACFATQPAVGCLHEQ